MNTDRIKEIQQETAYPESVSVQQALLKVWNETAQEQLRIAATVMCSSRIEIQNLKYRTNDDSRTNVKERTNTAIAYSRC
jgi:hypothetical protein